MAKKQQGVNEKKQKGNELKAANKAKKDSAAAAAAAKIEETNWRKGSNLKGEARGNAAAEKADEQARKRAEKAALLAAEENELAAGGKPKLKLTNVKKKGGKKKNDVSLLEDALVGNADKKAKADKRAARLKKEAEEMRRKEREQKKEEEMKEMDPLLANTNAMIGNSIDDNGRLNASLVPGEINASGIDSALASMKLSSSSSAVVDDHPEKRMKALHKAFEQKMMPQMKEEYPGLKRSQYLEKMFILWKKSPENPMNWQKE
mmetsp:Transcript_22377/g.33059  ORF Transcript_22377/g.33059 Transcript_22377/m.33059 type:complete len:262 (+) Transcript_22377:28-813(+)